MPPLESDPEFDLDILAANALIDAGFSANAAVYVMQYSPRNDDAVAIAAAADRQHDFDTGADVSDGLTDDEV